MEPDDPVAVLRRLRGAATLAELTRWTTRHRIRSALALGRLERAARGVYVLPALPKADLVAARCRGVISHHSAAERWGIPLLHPPTQLHLTVPHGSRPAPNERIRYHRRTLAPDEVDDGSLGRCAPCWTAPRSCPSLRRSRWRTEPCG